MIAFSMVLGIYSSVSADTVKQTSADNHEIKAPHYGDTLFHFFQDRYFYSVTSLMVSQHFGRVAQHAEEAEVLRGGILLSYGLHREAGEIFSHLIEHGASPATRDRAWYYLAKIRYQRGYIVEAEEAISHIGNALSEDLKEERSLLHANILMAREDYAAAANVLSSMNLKTPSARYARYNLGIAWLRSNNNARGVAMLDELGRSSAENEEFRSLRDRANVALGFSSLANKQPKAARNYLERVRLKSPQANKALLGLGWAAVSQKDAKFALVPWLELAQRDVNDAAVLEAQIAVPYAYAELGAYAQAAEKYNQAIATFTREDTSLTESITAIGSGKLVDALIESNPSEEIGWFWNMHDIPSMPHAAHLSHVLAQHAFQEAFKDYRDLRFLTKNLEEWRDKLSVFEDMLENRRKAFAERLPQVLERAKDMTNNSLRMRHDVVAKEVAAAEIAQDGVAFADTKQRDLLNRINSVQQTLKDPSDDADLAAIRDVAKQRARLTSGVLTWQLAQDFSNRSWQTKKELQVILEGLKQAELLDIALTQAQRDEPSRFDAFAKRIATVRPLLQATIERVHALAEEQKQLVQSIAIGELAHQQERLVQYATQARFAVAQLYDRGTDRNKEQSPEKKGGDNAKKN